MKERILYRNRLALAVVLAVLGFGCAVIAALDDWRMLLPAVLLGGCAHMTARVAARLASFAADRPLREAARHLLKRLP